MGSLEIEAAREYFYRSFRSIERGAVNAKAVAYSIPLGFYLWIVRDSADIHPGLKPTLGDEIMALYYRMKEFSPAYHSDSNVVVSSSSPDNVGNQHRGRILKFQRPR